MPPQVRKRGRPKGVYASVLGIPRKKKMGVIPFKKLKNIEKEKKILFWILGDKAQDFLNDGYIITKKDVPKHGDMSNELLDENVNLSIIFKHFTPGAFKKTERLLKVKRLKTKWICQVCFKEADGHTIGCDICLRWFHLKCVNLKKKPKINDWICRYCSKNKTTGKVKLCGYDYIILGNEHFNYCI